MKCLFCIKSSKQSHDDDEINGRKSFNKNYKISESLFVSNPLETKEKSIENAEIQFNLHNEKKNIEKETDKKKNDVNCVKNKNKNYLEELEKKKKLENINSEDQISFLGDSEKSEFNFPINSLFLLKNEENIKQFIFVKISIHFLNNLSNSFCEKTERGMKNNLQKRFSEKNELLFNLEIKKNNIIEKYLAKKIGDSNLVVLDMFSNNDNFALEVSKNKNLYIIVMRKNLINLMNIKKKTENLFLKNSFEFINCQLNILNFINADIIYLKPKPIFKKRNLINFSIFQDFEENIVKYLEKALDITENIILELPSYTDIKEIGKLCFLLIEKIKNKDRLSIEIDMIYQNQNTHLCNLIYFGNSKSFSKYDEIVFIAEKLFADLPNNSNSFIFDQIISFVKFLKKKLSIYILLYYFNVAEEKTEIFKSTFQKFVDTLYEYEVVSSEELYNFFSKPKNSMNSNITETKSLFSYVSSLNIMKDVVKDQISISKSKCKSKSIYSVSSYSFDGKSKFSNNFTKLLSPFQTAIKKSTVVLKKLQIETCNDDIKDKIKNTSKGFSKFKNIRNYETQEDN